MSNNKKLIAARLRQARIEAGYPTAKSFIDAHNLSAPAYGHHENATRGLSIEVALKYCDLLGAEPMWLFTGNATDNQTHQNQNWYDPDLFAYIMDQINLKTSQNHYLNLNSDQMAKLSFDLYKSAIEAAESKDQRENFIQSNMDNLLSESVN